ncbi:conserved exported hypothetical protein [Hyella patelloides LEGE 07179]|uniref:Uncharacterized protein n=1 Tax=Hyella patelloides LEGE 07179 TaxID=945734 RepID=A0A563VLH7_9CYAN|nr:hypothetical protein [Hyella patelloides]VEP12272.1 conserved exported hypothetical protein [Hyella patelloides LEGE 07179]
MNKQVLTVLGCSGSIALSLLAGNAAEANTNREYVFSAPGTNQELADIPASNTDYPFFDCSCNGYDADTMEALDREGDRAIARYGCDCAGCRRLVRSLEKTQKVQPSAIE